ncbi:hypothetical protein [Streptomyces sp. enrichment culture]|uniref:hypothetical protein n=1 Tax=Streptomyces sp. enrichment culture TaxID=1795815 RepID=UPI003F555031
MVDTAPAAVDVVAVVHVMRGALRHHLLAARRHLSYVLVASHTDPAWTNRSCGQPSTTTPAGRRMVTADLRALSRAASRTRPCCAR